MVRGEDRYPYRVAGDSERWLQGEIEPDAQHQQPSGHYPWYEDSYQ